MKLWKDEQGGVITWVVGLFVVCGILFGWLPHVLMSKNHFAAMSTFDIFNSAHFGENMLTAITLIIIFVPVALIAFFTIANDVQEHRDAKTAQARKEAERLHQEKLDYEAPNNVLMRYWAQKEIEHPETIVERNGVRNINKYRAERKPFDTMK